LLARPRWRSVFHKRHMLVERIMHWKVTFRNRVCATRFVLVDQLMHVRPHQVLGVFVYIFVVHLLAKDGCPTARATANADAQKKLEDRDDDEREAPSADRLASKPRPEQASDEAINECADAANAGAALDTRDASSGNPACLFRLRLVAFCCFGSGCGGAATSTTTAYDPIQNDHASENATHYRVRCVWLPATHAWDGWARNARQRRLGDLGGQTAGSA